MPITFLFIVHRLLDSVWIESLRYFIGASGVALLCWLLATRIAHRRIQTRRATNTDRLREVRQSMWSMAVFAVVDLITVVLIVIGAIAFNDGPPVLTTILWQTAALIASGVKLRVYSFATGEAAFEAVIVPLMIAVITIIAPAEPWAVFIFLGHQIARNAFGHAGFELAWPGFTRSPWTGWLTTTVHHDLHHSEGRYNFGLYFTWWDSWLGTEHPHYHERFEAVVNRRETAGQEMPVHGAVSP